MKLEVPHYEHLPVELKLPVEAPIVALRIDPAADKGTITLGEIRLKDRQGQVVRSWPEGR